MCRMQPGHRTWVTHRKSFLFMVHCSDMLSTERQVTVFKKTSCKDVFVSNAFKFWKFEINILSLLSFYFESSFHH